VPADLEHWCGRKGAVVTRMRTPPRRRSATSRAVAFAAFAVVVGAIGGAYTTVTGGIAVGAASRVVPAAHPPTANPNGALLGVVPSRPPNARPSEYSTSSAARAPRAAGSSMVTYHGGPVLHASYSPSNVYGSTLQYYETKPKRFVSYNVANKGPGIDTTPFPKSGCPNYTLADNTKSQVCLTRAQLQKEIAAYVSSRSIPTGAGTQVFLFTPQGVASCNTATGLSKGGCYNPLQYNGYCAYHSHFGSGNNAVIYANMPYNALQGCSSGQSPNGNPADAVLNNVAHEHNETMSDPLGTAWYDSAGREIGDKCHLKFGKALG